MSALGRTAYLETRPVCYYKILNRGLVRLPTVLMTYHYMTMID